jgi:hypothetical protein
MEHSGRSRALCPSFSQAIQEVVRSGKDWQQGQFSAIVLRATVRMPDPEKATFHSSSAISGSEQRMLATDPDLA